MIAECRLLIVEVGIFPSQINNRQSSIVIRFRQPVVPCATETRSWHEEIDHARLRPGPKRNFQVLDPLEFLAEFRAPSRSDGRHIPPEGSHTIRYYGWYSNKARGMRRKAAEAEAAEQPGGEAAEAPTPNRSSQTWAMLIKRVYEVDPLCCPKCQGEMRVIAFLEPPQAHVIEKILRHCALWHSTPNTRREGLWKISLDATSTYVLNAVFSILQAAAGRWPHFPERSLGCRIKTGRLSNPL